ncbi:hypothetical protein J4H92_13275 [Leucobacter weissii]|uniref:Uncharacterized protein n=1 Tax=Leucobacter weissii TaxID=1983706 RepID=A0A939MQU2_9MICO|nr:hypothetical protein [Leucobacter weissii]MBO1902916.1 hypothetical protein [Leucobacter weissii]
MTEARSASRRPWTVTLAVVLITVDGLLGALFGILVLLSRYRVDREEMLLVSLVGAGVVLGSLLTLAVASGIARGSRLSRILVTLYAVIETTLFVVTVIATDPWDLSSILLFALTLLVVSVLWLPPGSRHFTSREAAPDPLAPA